MVDAPKSFTVQAKNYFGLLPGQGLRDFSAELKRLTLADKQELADLLTDEGYPTIRPEKK